MPTSIPAGYAVMNASRSRTPAKRSHAQLETFDLTGDQDDGHGAQHHSVMPPKKVRLAHSEQDSPTSFSSPMNVSLTGSSPAVADSTAHATLTTTTTPPSNTDLKDKPLYQIPELADRYVPKTSTVEGVEYRNPRKFCLKPAYWRCWSNKTYVDFAETLRLQFDPIPFAREHDMPVEEVQAVFSSLVCNPLYNAVVARKRGEEGMRSLIAFCDRYGTPTRSWGSPDKDGVCMVGELSGIKSGAVLLVRDDGSKHEVEVGELNEVDIEYLRDTLTTEDARMLWGERDRLPLTQPSCDGCLKDSHTSSVPALQRRSMSADESQVPQCAKL